MLIVLFFFGLTWGVEKKAAKKPARKLPAGVTMVGSVRAKTNGQVKVGPISLVKRPVKKPVVKLKSAAGPPPKGPPKGPRKGPGKGPPKGFAKGPAPAAPALPPAPAATLPPETHAPQILTGIVVKHKIFMAFFNFLYDKIARLHEAFLGILLVR